MENICKNFPSVKALQDVSITFNTGEIHAIVGENGAGKSTLIKILMGVYQKTSGEIFIEDEKVAISDPVVSRRLGLSAVYQDVTIAGDLTVAENFFLGNIPKTKFGLVKWEHMFETAQKALDALNIEVDAHSLVKDLPVAQQEMVVIAKKNFDKSRLIIFDEPTALLANEEVEELFKIIRLLKSEGTAIVYISHRLEEIFELCDVVTVLKDGEWVDTLPVNETTEDELIRKMVGRKIEDMYSISHFELGEKVLEVKNFSKKGVFENINFDLHKGEMLGFFGLVGSGRTEIMRSIFGADGFDDGDVIVCGKKRDIKSPVDAINMGMGFLPEDRKIQGLALEMSVKENVNLASYGDISNLGLINLQKEKMNANEYVNKLRVVTPGIFQKVLNLSGGNQQKVVLAKWLCKESSIFIFDEPTVGIDVGAKTEIYKLLQELLEAGNAVIIISSYLPEIMGVADHIVVISEGKNAGTVIREDFDEEGLLKMASGIN
ncbi:MAG: sugar ABC transporter ATP-binding protein [Clostridiales bacterium]|nr:sugar ABC transporter ATP-binding protein [Clostridiales bacterium]